MKKKIKDLTFEEVKKICLNHKRNSGYCPDCPLHLVSYLCIKDLFTDRQLQQEVEIPEE